MELEAEVKMRQLELEAARTPVTRGTQGSVPLLPMTSTTHLRLLMLAETLLRYLYPESLRWTLPLLPSHPIAAQPMRHRSRRSPVSAFTAFRQII